MSRSQSDRIPPSEAARIRSIVLDYTTDDAESLAQCLDIVREEIGVLDVALVVVELQHMIDEGLLRAYVEDEGRLVAFSQELAAFGAFGLPHEDPRGPWLHAATAG